jgi:hypothetical protein
VRGWVAEEGVEGALRERESAFEGVAMGDEVEVTEAYGSKRVRVPEAASAEARKSTLAETKADRVWM